MKPFVAAFAFLVSQLAFGQAYPNKPIRIIVPYAAGGTSDILARQIGPKLSEAWGQPVVIENKTGANGNVGADFVAKSAPDGYTLLITDLGGLVISASVYPQLPFNPAQDFTPVVMVSYSPHVLAVHPSVPVKDVKELIAMAKANPDKLNFAISGIGGAPQLAGIEFAQRAGVKWTYIPYKGGSQAIQDTIGGQAQVLMNGMLATLPHVQSGKLKVLGVSKATRVPLLANVPTIAEQGVKGFESGTWQGMLMPAGTPPAVIAKLAAEVTRIIRSPEVRERLVSQGAEVYTMSPTEFASFFERERKNWASVVAQGGVKIE